MNSNTGRMIALICIGLLVLGAGTVQAQKKGQSATIQYGKVVGAEQVDLNDSKATQGAIVGGGIALAASSGKSSQKKRRNTAAGAIVGGAIGSAAGGKSMGMLYTVEVTGGAIQVVTDQTEIHFDDCVVVEETDKGANIRRVDPEVCNPAAAEVVDDLMDEFQEEAAECAAAKAEVAAAKTDDEIDLAMRKVSILCNG
jgi:hypothetical protein